MSKTIYLKNSLLDHTLKNVIYTPPSTIYLGLFITAPSDVDEGLEISTSGTGYIRQIVTFNTAIDGNTTNNNILTFGPATASWGQIVAFALFDSLTDGHMLYYGDATYSQTISTNDKVEIPIDGIVISEN